MENQTIVDRCTIHHGRCLDILPTLLADSIDSCVTDPPYHLASIVKRFGKDDSAPAKSNGATGVYARSSAGFMGKKWDGGDVAFRVETWAEVFRVLKPGAHLLAFGGTRTYHRMACAIEDAGFEIRDQIGWVYGSGFPKSHNLKGEWEGWGTALKPAWEPIVVARKPLIGTVAANVLEHGTGALNIDGCRVETGARPWREARRNEDSDANRNTYGKGLAGSKAIADTTQGRWPANIVHDGSEEVLQAFPHAPGQQREVNETFAPKKGTAIYGPYGQRPTAQPRGDSGSAARFFYCAKATKKERAESKHPTVKPVKLMRWLVRMVTPPRGTVLDPFAGTGTTGQAALMEGFSAVLIEKELDSFDDAEYRLRRLCGDSSPKMKQEALL